MMSQDVEKLHAIGYSVRAVGENGWHDAIAPHQTKSHVSGWLTSDPSLEKCWTACLEACRSLEGMKVTMASKTQWLIEHGPLWSSVHVGPEFGSDGPTGYFIAEQVAVENGKTVSTLSASGPTPEAAIDTLFWSA